MIDYFALALAHALLVIALLRILARGELDREEALGDVIAEPEEHSTGKRPAGTRQRKKRGDA
ncbi:hypothetical protein [Qipengyuania pacifica]|uniref:hypothetical protein n=1 Tax=Qipengyuania pacifica TaxID=2860199 RepID=UPI001C9D785B|nr:hypothetical protein [Qipengyuania pacifica]MBY8332516.1 hypothetical protein [Qipengyuania pacifica]